MMPEPELNAANFELFFKFMHPTYTVCGHGPRFIGRVHFFISVSVFPSTTVCLIDVSRTCRVHAVHKYFFVLTKAKPSFEQAQRTQLLPLAKV